MTEKAVVLVSGGIDSSVCLAIAAQEHDVIHPIHINYGQQTAELERQMAYNQCEHVAQETGTTIKKTPVIDYGDVFRHFAEGVASDRDSFLSDQDSLIEKDGRSTGYVPMRNLHLIATASAVADVEDADFVYHGAQGGDEEAYPDCRAPFMNAAQEAVNQSLADDDEVILKTPLLDLTKTEVIQKGETLPISWQHTYSCYAAVDSPTGTINPDPCGECPACEERVEAFEEAGVEDPYMP